jgi:hypothetical protein
MAAGAAFEIQLLRVVECLRLNVRQAPEELQHLLALLGADSRLERPELDAFSPAQDVFDGFRLGARTNEAARPQVHGAFAEEIGIRAVAGRVDSMAAGAVHQERNAARLGARRRGRKLEAEEDEAQDHRSQPRASSTPRGFARC